MKTPADWERVRELFHHALSLPPEERAAFLRRETRADEDSRREIESLLAAHAEAEGFLSDSPARATGDDDLPTGIGALPSGTRLGAFEILRLLGAGGMGEVYRARDTRLDREVAIKVLSGDLADDPGGRDRFEREARAISRMTHPHICTLYDVGAAEIDGREARFLVMELLDGETLAERLGRGALHRRAGHRSGDRDSRRARRGARDGYHPSRLEAGQHHADEVRRQAARLRAGAVDSGAGRRSASARRAVRIR